MALEFLDLKFVVEFVYVGVVEVGHVGLAAGDLELVALESVYVMVGF